MTTPILSIVSKKGCGKTTLIEKLLKEFKARGYKVGTVKHDTHGFDMDHEGKDTWRHKQAGADGVLISSPWKITLILDVDEELWLDQLVDKYYQDMDLVITEGYKQAAKTQVEVFQKAKYAEPMYAGEDNVIAILSDAPLDVGIPCFNLDDYMPVVDMVEARLLKKA